MAKKCKKNEHEQMNSKFITLNKFMFNFIDIEN